MKVLIACEYSGVVRDAFTAMGHDATSCDLLPTESESEWKHLIMDNDMHLRDTVYKQHWDLLIAHPPCTYLAVTANKWLKDQPKRKSGVLVGADRRQAQQEAIIFFMMLYNAPINKICIENPVGIMSTVFRKPDQILQPFNFGHKEQKKTCLWLKGLPRLNATNIVEPEPYHHNKIRQNNA